MAFWFSESDSIAETRKIAHMIYLQYSHQDKLAFDRRNRRAAVQRTSEVVCGLKSDRHVARTPGCLGGSDGQPAVDGDLIGLQK